MTKQSKSAIISGAGFVAGFVTDLVNAVREQGGRVPPAGPGRGHVARSGEGASGRIVKLSGAFPSD